MLIKVLSAKNKGPKHHMVKSRKQNFYLMKTSSKFQYEVTKSTTYKSFSSLHSKQNIIFRKKPISPFCRQGIFEWRDGYKIQREEK